LAAVLAAAWLEILKVAVGYTQGAQQIATTGSNLCMAMAIEWDNHGIHSGEKWFIVIKHPRMRFNTPLYIQLTV